MDSFFTLPSIKHHTLRGFTLVEMLVVLAIIAVITTIAVLGQSNFNRSVLLTQTAYSAALSVREAQSLGLASRRFGTGSSGVQNAGYGAHFDSDLPSTYVIFADTDGTVTPSTCPVGTPGTPDAKPGNCIYDDGDDGVVQTYNFTRGFRIADLCGNIGGTEHCANSGTQSLDSIDVVFIRSNTTDAVITAERTNGERVILSNAKIHIQDADGVATRGICVSQVGQVSVAGGTCP